MSITQSAPAPRQKMKDPSFWVSIKHFRFLGQEVRIGKKQVLVGAMAFSIITLTRGTLDIMACHLPLNILDILVKKSGLENRKIKISGKIGA
jgi:hypothetical protein